jgi:N-acetylneuraminate synthase/N,N'-diacetyllegionaminate synthase
LSATVRCLLGKRRPWVVAEIGVNHNGRREEALALVRMAARADVQAVKFQAFRAERLARPDAPLASYQERSGAEGQFALLRALEIDRGTLAACAAEARQLGLAFGVTPFDPDSLREILTLEPDFIKIGSGDADNFLLIEAARDCGRPVLVSTGMCSLAEVERLAGWFSGADERLALLHCVSAYPAPEEACNLAVLDALRGLGAVVGFSDHTLGARAAGLALALGAEIIERHITLDRAAAGPDHASSSDEAGLSAWLAELRATALVLGDGVKRMMPCEEDVRRVARKSILLQEPLRAGESLERSHVRCLRPADGLSCARLPGLLGRRARHDLPAGRLLTEQDLEEVA